MGGYIIHMDRGGEAEQPTSSSNLTLTAKGVLQLASLGYDLPDVPLQSIKDRSKADTFTKSIACLQAGYLVFQLIGRLASGLFITLLEINAFGHALCALIIFWFWLKKPYDIKSPITVTGSWAGPVAALWSMEIGYDIKGCSHDMNRKIVLTRHDTENFKDFIRRVQNRVSICAATNKTGFYAQVSGNDDESLHDDTEKVSPDDSRGALSR